MREKIIGERKIVDVKHGKDSRFIQDVMERINAAPMNEVQKFEFQNMLEETIARGVAFDVDSYIRQHLINSMKDFDAKILSYQSDLLATQNKVADMEKNIQFHKRVLFELKDEYIRETSPDRKKEILEDIDLREKAVADYEKQFQQLVKLRNEIRKEVDKNKYQEVALKQKETALKNSGAMAIDISKINLDDEE